jgi:hypothetical protein
MHGFLRFTGFSLILKYKPFGFSSVKLLANFSKNTLKTALSHKEHLQKAAHDMYNFALF